MVVLDPCPILDNLPNGLLDRVDPIVGGSLRVALVDVHNRWALHRRDHGNATISHQHRRGILHGERGGDQPALLPAVLGVSSQRRDRFGICHTAVCTSSSNLTLFACVLLTTTPTLLQIPGLRSRPIRAGPILVRGITQRLLLPRAVSASWFLRCYPWRAS